MRSNYAVRLLNQLRTEEISAKIEDKLPNQGDLLITVEGGKVTIRGWAEDSEKKKAIIALVKNSPGIFDVIDEIRLR